MKRPMLAAAVAVVAALSILAAASAYPALSVKQGGLWYWSGDLAHDGLLPPPTGSLTPYGGGLPRGVTNPLLALPLTPDQKKWLRAAMTQTEVITALPITSPALHDGTAIFSVLCRGSGKSIPSASVNVDLYHRFRCAIKGGKFSRLQQYKDAVNAEVSTTAATGAPVPQASLDLLVSLLARLGHYEHFGDPANRTVTLTVTGRRSATLG